MTWKKREDRNSPTLCFPAHKERGSSGWGGWERGLRYWSRVLRTLFFDNVPVRLKDPREVWLVDVARAKNRISKNSPHLSRQP